MNVFFTSFDGQVWVNRDHMKEIIRKELANIYPRSTKKRFADLLIGYLDSLKYKELEKKDERPEKDRKGTK